MHSYLPAESRLTDCIVKLDSVVRTGPPALLQDIEAAGLLSAEQENTTVDPSARTPVAVVDAVARGGYIISRVRLVTRFASRASCDASHRTLARLSSLDTGRLSLETDFQDPESDFKFS